MPVLLLTYLRTTDVPHDVHVPLTAWQRKNNKCSDTGPALPQEMWESVVLWRDKPLTARPSASAQVSAYEYSDAVDSESHIHPVGSIVYITGEC